MPFPERRKQNCEQCLIKEVFDSTDSRLGASHSEFDETDGRTGASEKKLFTFTSKVRFDKLILLIANWTSH